MDDYCWIHSTFHVRNEFQGNVGCILDQVLAGRESILLAAADTPDTAFYQWVPFTLVFQVSPKLVVRPSFSIVLCKHEQDAVISLATVGLLTVNFAVVGLVSRLGPRHFDGRTRDMVNF